MLFVITCDKDIIMSLVTQPTAGNLATFKIKRARARRMIKKGNAGDNISSINNRSPFSKVWTLTISSP